MKKISLLGCGWLGFPLAKALVKNGVEVNGSTTTIDKKTLLENAGISHFEIALESENFSAPMDDFLKDCEILIIAIPPKLRGKNKDYSDANKNSFVKKIENILPYIEKSTIQNLLFISSTAVYGESDAIITHKSIAIPATESGKQLLQVEQLLLSNEHFRTTILRFGGLIGEDRNPARFLAGKENVPNPDAPINLIHQVDCIGIILKILETNTWGTTLNAVTPFHPTRKEYYTHKALEHNLIPPSFDETGISIGKTIMSDDLIQKLNYTFKIANL